ncbi:hypothetical protein V6N12_031672 [Hibiscus sabdariffa]|uniref:Uncharacterized protein n=1 Tax=Hibiscus sabdariffa TaxID=183260 RepID=A0ABR2DWS5_9ROSI
MGFDEAATSKQPVGGSKTIAAARLAALSTMVETTKAHLEELTTDLRTYFKYVQERDQVIKANFNEMLPQSPLDFPSFPQDLFKPAATKAHEALTTQPLLNKPPIHPKTNRLDLTLQAPHLHQMPRH